MKITLRQLKESVLTDLLKRSHPTEQELRDKEESFSVGDRVKVSDNIRCKQRGKIGMIVEIRPGTHGWKDFIVKFDDPQYGSMGFQSGSIDHI